MVDSTNRKKTDNLSETVRKRVRELARRHPGAWIQPVGTPPPARKILNPDTDKEAFSEQRKQYEDVLERINSTYVTDRLLRVESNLSSLLEHLNEVVKPVTGVTESGLKNRIRSLLNRVIRSALTGELTRIDAVIDAATRVLNRLHEDLRAYAAAQAKWNARVAHFGQHIVPVMDEKVRYAYDTLNDLLVENVKLLVKRMDILHEGLDRKQEEVITWLENTHGELDDIKEMFEDLKQETKRGLALQHRKLERITGERWEKRSDNGAGSAGAGAPDRFKAAGGSYAYYLFESDGRGHETDIRRRQADYLSFFRGKAPVLDIGCGRGEFLELLREAGVEASGIDVNGDMITVCREKGLTVTQSEAAAFLSGCPDASFGGLFAAQMVEHLTSGECVRLMEEAVRVLRPGGVMVMETINTASPFALCNHYFKDPTHRLPLHPETYRFLMETAGFERVSLEYRSPVPETVKGPEIPELSEKVEREYGTVLRALARAVDGLKSFVFAHGDVVISGFRPERE